jgi:hypothetical protein
MNTQPKLSLLCIAFLLVFPLLISAQGNKENDTEELVKAEKIAFFTEKIGLSPSQAEKFWPVYNAYWEKKNKIISRWKKKFGYYLEHSEELSESELEELADDYIRFEMQKAELLKEYNKEFKEILPVSKVMKIYQADYEFKAYLLKKIKNSGSKNQQ